MSDKLKIVLIGAGSRSFSSGVINDLMFSLQKDYLPE